MKTKIVQSIKGLLCELVWLFHQNMIFFGAIWLAFVVASNQENSGVAVVSLVIAVAFTLIVLFVVTYFGLSSHKATLYGLPVLAIGYLFGFSPITHSLGLLHIYSFIDLFTIDHVHWSIVAVIFTIISFALQNLIILIRSKIKQK